MARAVRNFSCLPNMGGTLLREKRIVFQCDDEVVVTMINTKQCKIILTYRAQHIPGRRNEIADSLSRFQHERFRQLALLADHNPYPILTTLLTI